MPKRKTVSTSSSSSSDWESSSAEESSQSSIDDPSYSSGSKGGKKRKKPRQASLAKGKSSQKKARKSSTVSKQERNSHVASTSTQLQQPGIEIILTNETNVEAENAEGTDSLDQTMNHPCSSRSAGQSQRPVRRSKPVPASTVQSASKGRKKTLIKEPLFVRRTVTVAKPNEEYFEGCLVMGPLLLEGFPPWPGMIRKPGAVYKKELGDPWTKNVREGVVYVQFFQDPTVLRWRYIETLTLFDPAAPNKCNHRNPAMVVEFEKGIRMAKAAANFSVETRLTKFTLPDDWTNRQFLHLKKATFCNLLAEIDTLNSGHAKNVTTTQPPPQTLPNDAAATPPTPTNGRSVTEIVSSAKKRLSESAQRMVREKEEAMKGLERDNSKLTAELETSKAAVRKLTLQLNSRKDAKDAKIASLEKMLKAKDNEILKLQTNLKKTTKEKLESEQQLEKMKSDVENMELFDNNITGGGT